MGDSSMGAVVPSVKSEPETALQPILVAAAPLTPPAPSSAELAMVEADANNNEYSNGTAVTVTKTEVEAAGKMDKDFLCPICMQMIRDAFLTVCGHSFCYMCIVTHLQNKNDCPCCAHYLTTNQLFPNFLLNKLLLKTSARQIAKTASPFEQLRQALQQGCDVSVKELDSLLTLLSEKKRKMDQEEAETNLQIMHEFLHCLRRLKLEELNELQNDLQYIKEDINSVERRRIELYRARERHSVNLRMLTNDPTSKSPWPSLMDKRNSGMMYTAPNLQGQGWIGSDSSQNMAGDGKTPFSAQVQQRKDACSGSESQNISQKGASLARKRRILAQFNDLQECYLQKRRHWARQAHKQEEKDCNAVQREGYHAGLEDFQSVLSTFTRYSRLRVIAELRHGDLFHSANIVSSIEFDRDDDFFATAGVSRCIKVFEFSSVVNEHENVQCPIVEMSTRSKLSCLSWNKYTKNQIASSDYEGIVTVWDVTTRQSVMEYEEHEKRAWSVDFSRTEPSMLVSGSDDCKVKIWCTNQEASVLNIDMKANICSVKYNPGSSLHVAVGSADHHVHYYDLRNISQPLHIFSGHRKAVSYVKFLSNYELASASTDSTLRLWDVKENMPLRTFRGHTNEKNFVGLTVNKDYIACGSETNEVFAYHKWKNSSISKHEHLWLRTRKAWTNMITPEAISKPAAWHRFSSDSGEGEEDARSYFISAVCWKSDSPTMLTANSQGTIKALVLAA